MKTKIYAFLSLCLVAAGVQRVDAQCGARYHDQIFQNVTSHTNVTYSTSNSTTLKMDIFEPTGDTASMRPLLIMAHGGSFISGNKSNDNVCTQMCNTFAKRGYVTASIDYRLDPLGGLGMLDSVNAITIVMKAISDGKSAIRFFRKDAATTNTYKIDPNKVFVGGNSAGAVLYAHVAFIDSVGEAPAHLQTIINNNGGIEGNSGNDGYPSTVTALVNLAGGLNIPEFVSAGNTPSFNAQGDADLTVPYMCAKAQNGATPVRLCGLGAMEPLYQQYGLDHYSIVYPGEGHVPWQSNAAEMTEIDTTTANFLYPYACTGVAAGINDVKQTAEIVMFPNPASNELNIRSNAKVSTVSIFNNMGQLVVSTNFESNVGKVNTGDLSSGIYLVRIEFKDKNIATSMKKILVD